MDSAYGVVMKRTKGPKGAPNPGGIQALLGGLIRRENETYEKILVRLLEPDNVETKTQVDNPIALTRLDILSSWLRNEGVKGAANLVKDFAHDYRINMVSYKRQSRTEVVKALTEGIRQERTLAEKLTTTPSG